MFDRPFVFVPTEDGKATLVNLNQIAYTGPIEPQLNSLDLFMSNGEKIVLHGRRGAYAIFELLVKASMDPDGMPIDGPESLYPSSPSVFRSES